MITAYVPTAGSSENMTAPPLGLMPKWLHDERRMREILDAMDRYAAAKMPVPVEWISELRDLISAKFSRLRNE